jgi:polypeptide N-acetylgalactosaminyltransferase
MFSAHRTKGPGIDFVGRNLMRVVEVWFDDYKKYFYGTNEERYAKIDVGDLTKQFAFKERMKCKGFQWYLDNVAVDLINQFPIAPRYLLAGQMRLRTSELCLSLQDSKLNKAVILTKCSSDPQNPTEDTYFMYNSEKEIRIYSDWRVRCLDAVDLAFYGCHKSGGNQAFVYNPETLQISRINENKCLTGRGLNQPLYLTKCNKEDENQNWIFSKANMSALEQHPQLKKVFEDNREWFKN